MAIRLALFGMALLVIGVLDVGGFGVYTAIVGCAALAAAGVTLVRQRRREKPSVEADYQRTPGQPTPVSTMDRIRAIAPSIALNGVVPLAVYLLIRPLVSSDVIALAIAVAIPAVCTLTVFALRRKVDAIGVIAVAGFGIALIVVVLSGGNPFVLKLQEAVVTGPVGVAFVISAAVGKPLLLVAARLAGKQNQEPVSERAERARTHASTVLTAIMGVTLLIHAGVLTLLALTLPTSTVLAVSRLAGLAVLGAGLAVLLWYRSRLRASTAAPAPAGPSRA